MNVFEFWTQGVCLHEEGVPKPLLASWDKSTHPARVRLTSYLIDLTSGLNAKLPVDKESLFLHLDVNVQNPTDLLHHHDLENYLTPLFGERYLKPKQFALVSATKRVDGPSRVIIGYAVRAELSGEWNHFVCDAGAGLGSDAKSWKANILNKLKEERSPLPDGAAEVHLAWRCSDSRNWVNLWKPTGDTMGPVLGDGGRGLFNPNDDRITSLWMHRTLDKKLGHNVSIGMWWRNAANAP